MCQGLYLARLTGVTCLCSWVDMQMKCGGSQGQLVTVSNDLQLALLFALMITYHKMSTLYINHCHYCLFINLRSSRISKELDSQ